MSATDGPITGQLFPIPIGWDFPEQPCAICHTPVTQAAAVPAIVHGHSLWVHAGCADQDELWS